MQDFTHEQIQDKFDQLIPEMQAAISSPEIHDKIRGVGNKHSLMIDQIGELVDQVGLVMLGLAKSADFVRDTSTRLSIDSNRAKEIAQDINAEIFDSLKDILRGKDSGAEIASIKQSQVLSLEQAGGFEIEPEQPVNGEVDMRNSERGFSAFSSGEKADMISGIENPVPTVSRTERKPYGSTSISITSNPMTEPLVDQLLHGSTSSSEKKIEVTMDTKPIPRQPLNNNQPPANLPTNDPYREAMK